MLTRMKYTPLLLVLIASVIFLFNLGGTLLWDDDEPKNASCGREMLERGDWTVPTYNAELRPHKPILLYWAMIASYKTVGVSEFGARLPSALAGIGTVLLCYLLGCLLYDKAVGFGSGVLLASGLMFAVLSRAATPDAILIFCSTGAFYFFVRGMAQLRGGQFSTEVTDRHEVSLDLTKLPLKSALGMYVAIGFAVLAKGPIGVLLPMTIIGLYSLIASKRVSAEQTEGAGRWRTILLHLWATFSPRQLWRVALGLRVFQGAAVVALIALPWYVAVTIATEGQWLTGFLGKHNVHRFLHPMEGHGGSILYYVIAIMAGFFPASCFLPISLVKAVQEGRRRSPAAHAHTFLLIWVACYFTFFTIAATKLPNYIVPCYPALALLTGYWLVNAVRKTEIPRFWLRMGTGSCAVVGLALIIGMSIAATMHLDSDFLVPAAGLIPVLGGIICLVLLAKQRDSHAVLTFTATCALFPIFALGISAPRVSPYQTSPRIAQHLAEIEAAAVGDSPKLAYFRYTKPNVVFYLGKPVKGITTEVEAIEFLEAQEDSFLVIPEKVFGEMRDKFPEDVTAICTEPRFFKPEEKILIVGRRTQLAQRPTSTK